MQLGPKGHLLVPVQPGELQFSWLEGETMVSPAYREAVEQLGRATMAALQQEIDEMEYGQHMKVRAWAA